VISSGTVCVGPHRSSRRRWESRNRAGRLFRRGNANAPGRLQNRLIGQRLLDQRRIAFYRNRVRTHSPEMSRPLMKSVCGLPVRRACWRHLSQPVAIDWSEPPGARSPPELAQPDIIILRRNKIRYTRWPFAPRKPPATCLREFRRRSGIATVIVRTCPKCMATPGTAFIAVPPPPPRAVANALIRPMETPNAPATATMRRPTSLWMRSTKPVNCWPPRGRPPVSRYGCGLTHHFRADLNPLLHDEIQSRKKKKKLKKKNKHGHVARTGLAGTNGRKISFQRRCRPSVASAAGSMPTVARPPPSSATALSRSRAPRQHPL